MIERKPYSFLYQNKKMPKSIAMKKGLVLVVTIWLVIIMSIFGVGLARAARADYFFARFRMNKFISGELVNAVLVLCKKSRMADESLGCDTLAELEQETELTCGPTKIVYFLVDEEGKININTASSSVLKELPDMDMEKAGAIVNSEFRPFLMKEEILKVEEIEEEDYGKIKDLITVYGDGQINANTCSEEVMEIIGIDSGVAEKIVSFRIGDDGKLYTEDDGVFSTVSDITAKLEEKYGLSNKEKLNLMTLVAKGLLSVKSGYFSIEATVSANQKIVDRYSIVIGKEKNTSKYSVKRWEAR